jgi:hypothetical protein
MAWEFQLNDIAVLEPALINLENVKAKVIASCPDEKLRHKSIIRLSLFSVREKPLIKATEGMSVAECQKRLGIQKVAKNSRIGEDDITLYRVLRAYNKEIREYAHARAYGGWAGYEGECPQELQFVGSWEGAYNAKEAEWILHWLDFAIIRGLTSTYKESALRILKAKGLVPKTKPIVKT